MNAIVTNSHSHKSLEKWVEQFLCNLQARLVGRQVYSGTGVIGESRFNMF